MRLYQMALLTFAPMASLCAAGVTPKDVREMAKAGPNAIPKMQQLLKNPDLDVRIEAVKQITALGTVRSLEPLVLATEDNDPEMQIRATDGLVNFYLPGYLQTGLGASIKRVGASIKAKFSETNDQEIDPYVTVRPEVIEALGKLARGGGDLEARANAARAVGILHGKAAVPDLVETLHTKDTDLIYESLNALQKIRDESASPRITFLLRDLNPKVQIAAIETTGLLQNKQALPELVDALNRARDIKVRRAALTAIARLPAESSRQLYVRYLTDKDDKMRTAAAEGYARLRSPADLPVLEKAWKDEGKTTSRLGLGFAQVMLGMTDNGEFSPFTYLINTLNSASYKDVALAYLTELARDERVRRALYQPLESGTKDEKIGLAGVLGQSGDKDTVPHLEKISTDSNGDVAQAGLRALRTLRSRL